MDVHQILAEQGCFIINYISVLQAIFELLAEIQTYSPEIDPVL
jgi:hypothetical protein